jgi:hypothetical protein
MLRAWHVVVFLVAVVVFAVALAPAKPFLRQTDGQLTYSRIEGPIWKAKLHDAQLGGLDAGDVDLSVSLSGLLLGRLVADADLRGKDLNGHVQFARSLGGGVEIRAPSLSVSGAPVPGLGRMSGQTRISDLAIAFVGGVCKAASGSLQSDALVRAFASPGGEPGPELSGAASCVGAAARLPLAGERDGDALETWLELAGDGTGLWRMTVRTRNMQRAAALAAAGLQPGSDAGSFASEGRFRWLTF